MCSCCSFVVKGAFFFFFLFFSGGSSNEDTSVSLAPQISLRTEWSTNSACLTCSKSAANSSTSWASVVFQFSGKGRADAEAGHWCENEEHVDDLNSFHCVLQTKQTSFLAGLFSCTAAGCSSLLLLMWCMIKELQT